VYVEDKDKFANTTQTKAVYGICIDPQWEQKGIASYLENQVYIWDLRKFDKPAHSLPLQKSSIVKVPPYSNVHTIRLVSVV